MSVPASVKMSQEEAPYPYHKSTLPRNGVRVATGPMTGVKSGTLILSYNVGSRFEPAEIGGVSHYLEHMLFKGTERRRIPSRSRRRSRGRRCPERRDFTGKHQLLVQGAFITFCFEL